MPRLFDATQRAASRAPANATRAANAARLASPEGQANTARFYTGMRNDQQRSNAMFEANRDPNRTAWYQQLHDKGGFAGGAQPWEEFNATRGRAPYYRQGGAYGMHGATSDTQDFTGAARDAPARYGPQPWMRNSGDLSKLGLGGTPWDTAENKAYIQDQYQGPNGGYTGNPATTPTAPTAAPYPPGGLYPPLPNAAPTPQPPTTPAATRNPFANLPTPPPYTPTGRGGQMNQGGQMGGQQPNWSASAGPNLGFGSQGGGGPMGDFLSGLSRKLGLPGSPSGGGGQGYGQMNQGGQYMQRYDNGPQMNMYGGGQGMQQFLPMLLRMILGGGQGGGWGGGLIG